MNLNIGRDIRHIFENGFNAHSQELQLEICEEHFPIGTVVDLNDSMYEGVFKDGGVTAIVVGYVAIFGAFDTFDNYCIVLNKELMDQITQNKSQSHIHPSLLVYNEIYIRDLKIDKLLKISI